MTTAPNLPSPSVARSQHCDAAIVHTEHGWRHVETRDDVYGDQYAHRVEPSADTGL